MSATYLLIVILVIVLVAFTLISLRNSARFAIGNDEKPSLFVRDPWYKYIKNGTKTVEGRRGQLDKYRSWVGKVITIRGPEDDSTDVRVTSCKVYFDLEEYIKEEGIANVAPHLNTVEEVVHAYNEFYSSESIKKEGICALRIERETAT